MKKYLNILALSLGLTFSLYAKEKVINVDSEVRPYRELLDKMKDRKNYSKPTLVEAEHYTGQDDSECLLDHSEDTFRIEGPTYKVNRIWGMNNVDFNLNGKELGTVDEVGDNVKPNSIFLKFQETPRFYARKYKGKWKWEILAEQDDKVAVIGYAEETKEFKRFLKDLADALDTAVNYTQPFAKEKLKQNEKSKPSMQETTNTK